MNKKIVLISIASAAVIGIGALGARFGYMYNVANQYSNTIYPKVFVENIDLSGKSKEEALKLLSEKYGQEVLKKKIIVRAGDRTYTIDYSKLSGKYNMDEAVNDSFSYGKDSNIFKKYELIKKPEPKDLELKFTYDSKPIKELVAGIQKDIDKTPSNASIKMTSRGNFSVTADKKGAKLNAEKLEKDINSLINGDLTGDAEVQAPVDVLEASVTAEALSKINTKISSFSTTFSGSTENRVTNISLATGSISGKVFMPGDSFSFNDIVGKRTAAKGYKEAPVIVNNKLDSGLGGGICQVSTTLYNAVMRANINATERTHHSLPSHYVGLGLDATVDFGRLDYKFVNTLQTPIYIEGYTAGKTLIFNIYSDKSLANKTYELVSETYDTTKANIKYINDSNMYEGETETVQKASDGYKVKVYRKIYENGKLTGQETVTNETYKKIDGIVKRGTKTKPTE
jgi:vancomycin resistance protein YoaR